MITVRCPHCSATQQITQQLTNDVRCPSCQRMYHLSVQRNRSSRPETLQFPDFPIVPVVTAVFDDSSMASSPDPTPDSGGFDGGGGGDFGGGGASGDF